MDIMNISISIAAIIVALGFAALVGYLAKTLTSAQRTLNNVADTVKELEKLIEGITTETTLLLAKTNDLAADINSKSARLDNVFYGVDELGGTFFKLTQTINRFSSKVTKTPSVEVEKTTQSIREEQQF